MSPRRPRTKWTVGCRSVYSGPTVHESRQTLPGDGSHGGANALSSPPALNHCGTIAAVQRAPTAISIIVPRWLATPLVPVGAQYRRKGASDGQQEFRRVAFHCLKTSETHDGNYTCIPGYTQPNRGTQKTSRDDLGRNGIPGSGPATAMLRPPAIEIAPGGWACCLEPETGKRDR